MKNKENIYNVDVPETPAKNPALKYILIAVLLIAAAGIWWWQSNSKISENATAVNSDSVMTTCATGNINEPEMVTVQGDRFAKDGNENNNEKPIQNFRIRVNKPFDQPGQAKRSILGRSRVIYFIVNNA